MSELGERLYRYLEWAVPFNGRHILTKQCHDMGIEPGDIRNEDLEELAKRVGEACEMFLGHEGAHKLERNIRNAEF